MWYLVLSRPTVSPEELRPHLSAHLPWMKAQHEAGNVLFSGPTTDLAVGIYVVRAASKDDAVRLIDTDPLHAQRVRRYEVLEWDVHQVLGAGPFSSEGIGEMRREREGST